MSAERVTIVTLCTGNAARSVMAAFMLEHWGGSLGLDLEVISAGTHVVEGQPMGMRTRAALASIPAMQAMPFSHHRSKQLSAEQLARADLVVAMEADHVRFVRRHHPEASSICATLRRLAEAPIAGDAPLGERVAALHLDALAPDPSEDVSDPAGGDVEVYVECARELWRLTEELASGL